MIDKEERMLKVKARMGTLVLPGGKVSYLIITIFLLIIS